MEQNVADPLTGPAVDRSAEVAELQQELAGLRLAVASRDVVGQAKGILMERHGLDAERAFGVLVRLSQSSHTKLRRLAEDLVRTGRLPVDRSASPHP